MVLPADDVTDAHVHVVDEVGVYEGECAVRASQGEVAKLIHIICDVFLREVEHFEGLILIDSESPDERSFRIQLLLNLRLGQLYACFVIARRKLVGYLLFLLLSEGFLSAKTTVNCFLLL